MNFIKYIIFFIFIVFISINGFAQNSSKRLIKKADALYFEKAYIEAIPLYEKALKLGLSNKSILSNLANSCRLTNNLSCQIRYYAELINLGEAEPLEELYYGEALVENGEADKAKPYFEKFSADGRGASFVSSYNKEKEYQKYADAYELKLAPFNSTQNDMCAVTYKNEIVFASTRIKTQWINKQHAWTDGTYLTLYKVAKGSSPKDFIKELDSKYNDGPVCFSNNYKTIFVTRNNLDKLEKSSEGSFKLSIFEAQLNQDGFTSVKSLPFCKKDHNYAHPSVSQNGRNIYFVSDMPGGFGGLDLYTSIKDSVTGVWGEPINLGDKINTAGNEMFPFISFKGDLYFSSNGRDGLGGLDIYEARIKGEKILKVFDMGLPINSKDDDFGIYLNEDDKSGFITSNRGAGGLNDDIYELSILREVNRGSPIKFITKDKATGEVVPNTKLVFEGDSAVSDDKGEVSLMFDLNKEYNIEALKTDYYNTFNSVTVISEADSSIRKDLYIDKDPKSFLKGLITDAKSNNLLDSVTIKVTDLLSGEEFESNSTTNTGDYSKALSRKRIGEKIILLIRLEKRGYIQRTIVFTHEINQSGEINLNQFIKLSLGKVEVGMDVAKMIDMKPIYFDMGKAKIRPDAAVELDKIVTVLKEYSNIYIELGSHTDCRSAAAFNLQLSAARSRASAEYIIKKGINRSRITTKGYGESKLLINCGCEGKVKSNCSEEDHAKNRRTEFLITKLK